MHFFGQLFATGTSNTSNIARQTNARVAPISYGEALTSVEFLTRLQEEKENGKRQTRKRKSASQQTSSLQTKTADQQADQQRSRNSRKPLERTHVTTFAVAMTARTRKKRSCGGLAVIVTRAIDGSTTGAQTWTNFRTLTRSGLALCAKNWTIYRD